MADVYRDFVYTRNTVATNDVDTTITVEDVSLFPPTALVAKQDFFVAFESALSYPHTFEIMKVVKVDTALKQLQVVRAQGGTAAVPHSIATYIKGTLTSDMLRRMRSGLYGTQLPSNDADGLVIGDRFFHQTERRFYVWTGITGQLRDTFTRANSTTSLGSTETGSSATGTGLATATKWNNVQGVFGIADNKAYVVLADGSDTIALTSPGGYDIDFSMNITLAEAAYAVGTTSATSQDIAFRMNATAVNGYLVTFQKTNITLWRKSNGVYTSLVSVTGLTYADSATANLRVIADGNNIRVRLDGSERINFNETSAGYTLGTNFSNIGTNLGVRAGGTSSASSTTARWDDLVVNHPTSTVGGWQPVSEAASTAEQTSYQYATQIATIAAQVDDYLPILQTLEEHDGRPGEALGVVAQQLDDLLPIIQGLESDTNAVAMGYLAATVDDLITLLQGNIQTGVGPPSTASTPRDGWLYLDRAAKRIYVGHAGSFIPLTYSGPDFIDAGPTYATGERLYGSGQFTIPAGVEVGDTVFACFNTAHTSAQVQPPAGWTNVYQSNIAPQYVHNSMCLAYKVMQSTTDLSATYTFGNSTTGLTQVRAYRHAKIGPVVGTSNHGANGGTFTFPTVTTDRSSQSLVTWVATTSNYPYVTLLEEQQSVLDVDNHSTYHAQGSMHEDLLGTGVASPTRTVKLQSSSQVMNYALISMLVTGDVVPLYTPGALIGTGVPVATAGYRDGAVYIDLTSLCAWTLSSGVWVMFGDGFAITTQTANYTMTALDQTVIASGIITITLPPIGNKGRVFRVKNISIDTVTVVPQTGTIDGQTSVVIGTQYSSLDFMSDGTNWWLI